MKLRCWRKREYRFFDHSEFAAFKADHKYVMGVLPGGDEWFLPHCSTLKKLALDVPELIFASRSTLVRRDQILGVTGPSRKKNLHTTAGDFRVSRDAPADLFVATSRACSFECGTKIVHAAA